jgi:replicative DNA helicase
VTKIPHSDDAEKGILSSMLQDRACIATVVEQVTESQLYVPAHKVVFGEIVRFWTDNKLIDLVSFTQHLRDAKLMYKIGGEGAMEKLWWFVPSSSNIAHYIQIVADKHVLREAYKLAAEIAKRAIAEPEDVHAFLAESQAALCALGSSKSADVPISAHVDAAMDELEHDIVNKGKKDRIPTGLIDLDRKLTIMPSDLVVISAATSEGKTSLALNIVEHTSIFNKQGAMVFSIEMPARQLIFRMMGSQGRVNIQDAVELGKQEHVKKLIEAASRIRTAPIFIEDDPDLTVLQIRAKARKKIQEHSDIKLIVVDYLQILSDSGRKETNEAQELSGKALLLKRMARELKVAVILLSQENDEGRLFGSRGPKHHADTHIRISHNDEGSFITIEKQRNGPRNKSIKVQFSEQFTRFDNAAKTHIT